MNMRSLAVGLVLGFAAGAATMMLLRVEPEGVATPAPEAGPATRAAPSHGEPFPEPSPPTTGSVAEASALEVFRTGTAEEIFEVTKSERTFSDAEVQALIARLDASFASGDGKLFGTARDALCKSGTDTARKRLLELFVDDRVHDMGGNQFVPAFLDSDLPGIADAARRRFELNLEAGSTSWFAAGGWFELVAQHGDAQDIVWLLDRRESEQIRRQAHKAIARSPKVDAVEATKSLFRSNRIRSDLLRDFGAHHPDLAFDLTREMMDSGKWSTASSDDNQVYRYLGSFVPAGRIGELRDTLLGLTDDSKRVAAVYAVEQISKRGLDTTGFESIIAAPLEVLERPEGSGSPRLRSSSCYAIEYNSIMWSERAANALEQAGNKGTAAKVRTKLRSPWKGR